ATHSSITPQPQQAPAAEAPAMLTQPLTADSALEPLQRLPIQCRLNVGAVDDPLEKEADNIADTVMRMPEPSFIQRKCAHCEEEEKVQRKPLTPFIQKQEAPSPPTPATPHDEFMRMIESVISADNQARLERTRIIRERVLEPLTGARADGITFLNRLRNVTPDEADLLIRDTVFFGTIRRYFRGRTLWTVYTILQFHNHTPEPHLRLSLAVSNHDARLLADMLSIVVLQSAPDYDRDIYFTMLREVVTVEFSGDPLLNELLRLIDHRDDANISQRHSTTYEEAHYERPVGGGNYAMQQFTGHISANSYISGTELRVIVRMRFVDGNDTAHCPTTGAPGCSGFYFLGANAGVYDRWMNAITSVWNRHFYITNGTLSYNIVFVPLFLSEPDPDAVTIRVMTNNALTCAPNLTPGRSEQTCWFLNVPNGTVAHEFGHIIGASDEYNLPGTSAEITAAIPGFVHTPPTAIDAENLALSNMQGMTGSPQAAPDLTSDASVGANRTNTIMGDSYHSTNVHTRHLTRLLRLFNAGLPAGTTPFNLRTGSRPH
ncbi:MAG TPA: hypothetical protein VIM87_13780, partial [Chitinophaga sp.]|uniref:hypothetical protein n=1 Tax=Chitinophaga sp. TaxID=1869181 RepID=UPI002F91CA36